MKFCAVFTTDRKDYMSELFDSHDTLMEFLKEASTRYYTVFRTATRPTIKEYMTRKIFGQTW